MEKWCKETKTYDLGEGFTLERADDNKEFSIFYNIYKNSNVFHRINWSEQLGVIDDNEICFWINKNDSRIGGVCVQPNEIMGLFLIPPYSDIDNVLGKIMKLVIYWSDRSKKICTYTVLSDQIEHYQRLGFKVSESRRVMIRPTQHFDVNWHDKFIIQSLNKENASDIANLLYETEIFSKRDIDKDTVLKEMKDGVKFYFNNYYDINAANKASTLIYDKETKELIGVCLISIWSEWPLVYEIGVKPSYRGNGLARKMLQKALSDLKEEYDLLRLFVTIGNAAENLYYKLGFLPKERYSDLYIPAEILEIM